MSTDPTCPALHLPARYLAIVQDILRRYLPHAEVWAYGSRVKGDHHDASDLDLVARQPDDLTRPQPDLDEVAAAFSDSDLPILVQIVDWARIPEAFREEIEARYVVLVRADSAPPEPTEDDVDARPHPDLLTNPVWEPGPGSAASRAGTTRRRRAATDDWKTMTLEEAGVRLHDCLHKTPAEFQDGAYRYIAIPQMVRGHLDFASARRISESDFLEWTLKANPQAHDVVLSRRCNPGETSYVSPGETFALGQNLVLLRADGSSVYPPFLRWLVRGPQWWEQIRTYLNVGAVFDSLKCRDVPRFEFDLPPLREQRAIAGVLGALDDKIEQNRRTVQALERLARAIFRAWFVDFEPVKAKAAGATSFPSMPQPVFDALPTRLVNSEIGPVPEGWDVRSLANCVQLTMGQSPPSEHYNFNGAGLPFHQGVTDYGFRFPSHRVYCTVDSRLAEPRDVLLSVRAPVGRINVADRPLVLGRGLAGLRHPEGRQSFLLYQTFHVFADEDAVGDGTIYKAVTKSFLSQMPLLSPPEEAQAAFEDVAQSLDDLIASHEAESRQLADMRDYLLPKLLNGDVRLEVTSG